MDPEEAESREQQLLEDAFSYRTEKQYPEGATENRKRVIRKKAAKCVVKDGVFFYKMKNKDIKVCVCVCSHGNVLTSFVAFCCHVGGFAEICNE